MRLLTWLLLLSVSGGSEVKKVIQIIETATDRVEHEIDVTGQSERSIERTEDGVNINLNHEQFHTNVTEVEE